MLMLMLRQISPGWQGAPVGPHALVLHTCGQFGPVRGLMQWPQSGGPQQTSSEAQTLPPQVGPVPVPPVPPLPPLPVPPVPPAFVPPVP
jgi:hypothetical protein